MPTADSGDGRGGTPGVDRGLLDWWMLVMQGFHATQDVLASELAERFNLRQGSAEVLVRLLAAPKHRMPMTRLAYEARMSSGGFTKVADRLCAAGLTRRMSGGRGPTPYVARTDRPGQGHRAGRLPGGDGDPACPRPHPPRTRRSGHARRCHAHTARRQRRSREVRAASATPPRLLPVDTCGACVPSRLLGHSRERRRPADRSANPVRPRRHFRAAPTRSVMHTPDETTAPPAVRPSTHARFVQWSARIVQEFTRMSFAYSVAQETDATR
ncbi:hypothetical protein EDD90_1400 [Streptomyces sp. Ag109_O5-1]|nr:hypothetical protein EDD90_1400 [Streptomyces sp. Ag109_O5-1]